MCFYCLSYTPCVQRRSISIGASSTGDVCRNRLEHVCILIWRQQCEGHWQITTEGSKSCCAFFKAKLKWLPKLHFKGPEVHVLLFIFCVFAVYLLVCGNLFLWSVFQRDQWVTVLEQFSFVHFLTQHTFSQHFSMLFRSRCSWKGGQIFSF